MRMARSSANIASNVMPSSRKGSEINHASGQSTSASKATGQHRTSNRNQATNTNKGLIGQALSTDEPELCHRVRAKASEPVEVVSWALEGFATTAV
jgi:hypothetical protein